MLDIRFGRGGGIKCGFDFCFVLYNVVLILLETLLNINLGKPAFTTDNNVRDSFAKMYIQECLCSVTMSRVTCFILRAHKGTGVSQKSKLRFIKSQVNNWILTSYQLHLSLIHI